MILRTLWYLVIGAAILVGSGGPGRGEDNRFPGSDWERVSSTAGWSGERLR
jgi:hypothetical protein